MENELEKVLEQSFTARLGFAQEIENVVKENPEMNYIDAVVYYCEENKIDFDSVSKLISKPLKEKIKGQRNWT